MCRRSVCVVALACVAAAGQVRAQAGATGERLPVAEMPAAPDGHTLAIVLSGDGGWAPFDRQLAQRLVDRGVAVVGVDLRSYLGTRRTPEAMALDMAAMVRHYLEAWSKDRFVLVGYSRGAVVAPFVVNRLPPDLRSQLDLVAMLGLGFHAGFHVSLLDLLHTTTNPKDPAVLPEIAAAHEAGVPMLCAFGVDEKESLCRDGPEGLMVRIGRSGGHHFDGRPASLADEILARLTPLG